MNRLPAHAMALPTASALDSPPAVEVSSVGTAWRAVLLAGSLLGGAWLCWPPLAPLCAHIALLPLLRLWRDDASPALLAAASLATMVCAHLLALGYFLFIDPLPALVAIWAQSVIATLPLLVLAVTVQRASARRWLWALPALWAANEQLIAQLPTMVPMPLGGALAVWPSGIWFYAWTGVLGGTLLLVTSQIWWVCSPLPTPVKARRALLGLALLHGLGLGLLLAESSDAAKEPALALVRTGAAPTNTDSPAWYDQALHLNSQAVRDGAQLLVWPEAMISWRVWQEEEHPLRRALLAHLRAHAVPLLVGFNAAIDAFTLYNGAALLHPGEEPDTAPAYFKRWLMPYRENTGLFGLGRGWIRAGAASAALSWTDEHGRQRWLGPLICYEVLIAEAARQQVRAGAQLLVVLTNDVEFAATPASWQLRAQAQARAVESGRDLVRIASIGRLQHIDAQGRLRLESAGSADYRIVRPAWHSTTTFWVRHGAWLPWLLIALAAALGALAAHPPRRRNDSR